MQTVLRPERSRTEPTHGSTDALPPWPWRLETVERRFARLRHRDGLGVRLRPILPGDGEELARAFDRLSHRSRYLRFGRRLNRLTPAQLAYFTDLDYRSHFAWAVVADEPAGPAIVATARFIAMPDEPGVAEAAFTVVDDYQRRGIGGLLLQLVAIAATANGLTGLCAFVDSENRAMRALLRRFPRTTRLDGYGLLRVDLDPDAIVDGVADAALVAGCRQIVHATAGDAIGGVPVSDRAAPGPWQSSGGAARGDRRAP